VFTLPSSTPALPVSTVEGMLTRRLGSALLAVAAVAVLGMAQTGRGAAALRDLGLVKSSSYTALSFREPLSLPSHLPAGLSVVPVAFSIRNVSNSGRVYRWSILLSNDVPRKHLATGVVRVAAGSAVAVNRTVMAKCAGKKVHLVVRLVSPAESIGFWATCSAEKVRKNHG
jgi:hypothetical protein